MRERGDTWTAGREREDGAGSGERYPPQSPGPPSPQHPFTASLLHRAPISTAPDAIPWPRPLASLTAAFMFGLALEQLFPAALPLWFSAAAVALALATQAAGVFRSAASHRPCSTGTFFVSLFLFAGLGLLAARSASPPLPAPASLEPFLDAPRTLFVADLAGPPDVLPERVRIPLRLVAAVSGEKLMPVEGGVQLTLPSAALLPSGKWTPGSRVMVRLTLKRFHNFNNPGGFDYVRHKAEEGIFARANLSDDRLLLPVVVPKPPLPASLWPDLRKRVETFRQQALQDLSAHLDPDTAAFSAALLLGYQHLIPQAWQDHLARSGVTHLLSISGLHLGLVFLTVFWLGRWAVRLLAPHLLHRLDDQQLALWPAFLAATLYALVSGFSSAPVWRSLLMLAVCLGATLLKRRADALTGLALAALVILVADPNGIGQISFQLSFTCMMAIFVIYPRLEWLTLSRIHPLFRREGLAGKILRPFEEAFRLSVAVNLLVLPLTVHAFYGFSLAGFAANIVLVPYVGFLFLPAGLLGLGLLGIFPVLALPILKGTGWVLEGGLEMIRWFSDCSWAYFWVGTAPISWLAGFYGGMAVWLWGPWSRRLRAAAFALLALAPLAATSAASFVAAWSAGPAGTPLRVHFIDVGQGTSTLIRFPDGPTMLVDGGGFLDDSWDVGRWVVAPFLWQEGIRRLDTVVLSHDHPDHGNGLRFVLSHFDVRSFWESGLTEGCAPESDLAGIARKRGILVRRLPDIFGEHAVGPCRVEVLHPSPELAESQTTLKPDLNNLSLVLRVTHGETQLLLPGDIEQAAEEALLNTQAAAGFLPELVLVAPHHGSGHSSSPRFVKRLKPQAVIFTCGPNNLFGFPSPQTLERWQQAGAICLRTDLHGAVVAVSDGRRWALQTTRISGQ